MAGGDDVLASWLPVRLENGHPGAVLPRHASVTFILSDMHIHSHPLGINARASACNTDVRVVTRQVDVIAAKELDGNKKGRGYSRKDNARATRYTLMITEETGRQLQIGHFVNIQISNAIIFRSHL